MIVLRTELDSVVLFGKDRAQEDRNLKHYFVKTQQYKDIKNGSKELVLGRKGSGKSALFTMLSEEAEKEPNTIPVKISFDGEDFIYIENWLKRNDFLEPLNDDFKYSLAWKNFILNEIIYASIPYVPFFDEQLKQKLIHEGIVNDSSWKRFASAILNVFKGGKLETSFGELDLDFSSLTNLSQPDRDKIRKALNDLINNNSFLIVIDNLDEPWKNNSNMNSWLRGLLFAIRQLKRDYNNLRPIAFLRTDIYEIISKGSDLFDSKSEIANISWDDNNYYSLKQLVAARIAHYFNLIFPESVTEIDNCWNAIFPTKIVYNKNGRPVYLSNYMIDRTFQRPRELLQFCRFIVEDSKTKYLPVETNAISPAEIRYSNWKLIDLAGEYSKSYQNIDKCILSFVGVSSTWDWECQNLLLHLQKLDNNDQIIDATTNNALPAKESVDFLYRSGFLRKVIKVKNKKPRYRMYFQDSNINYNKTIFDIHPAFRKKFTTS